MTQETAAEKNGISLICVRDLMNKQGTTKLLPDTIAGAEVYYHSLFEGDVLALEKVPDKLRTFLLIDGSVSYAAKQEEVLMEGRGTYVSDHREAISIQAKKDAHILEIQFLLQKEGHQFLEEYPVDFPVVQVYDESIQYREDFKSKKAISRALIDHHLLPGFCMGSNESYGPDRVEKHAHPLLDQFFFSFEENQVELMIDDMIQPLEGNTLIRIPLGSDHGVIIPEGKKMHYVWIDFMVDPGAVAYLDEVHKKTGVKEKYDENGQMIVE